MLLHSPKEQVPRKLSGKRTVIMDKTLERSVQSLTEGEGGRIDVQCIYRSSQVHMTDGKRHQYNQGGVYASCRGDWGRYYRSNHSL